MMNNGLKFYKEATKATPYPHLHASFEKYVGKMRKHVAFVAFPKADKLNGDYQL